MAVVTCTGFLLSIVLPACSADVGLVNVMKNFFSLDGKTTFRGSSSKGYFACIHKIHFLIKVPVPFLFEIAPPLLLFSLTFLTKQVIPQVSTLASPKN